jgi:hypothetical protein
MVRIRRMDAAKQHERLVGEVLGHEDDSRLSNHRYHAVSTTTHHYPGVLPVIRGSMTMGAPGAKNKGM